MIPTAARVSGTYNVDMIGANALGNPVHNVTRTKINHTWFASQTGPIDSSMSSRAGAPRCADPATRSQKPAPKSAPANNAYSVMPANIAAATASASFTRGPRTTGPGPVGV